MTNSIEKFASYQEAANFKTHCPYCNKHLAFKPANASKYQGIVGDQDPILIDSCNGVKIEVNLKTNEIVKVEAPTGNPFGTYYTALLFGCSCPNYQYCIKLILNLTNKTVKELSLNSETVRITKDDIIYNIFISYSFGTIEMTKSIAGIHQNKLTIPLVTLDISDRDKILETLMTYAAFL